MKETKNKTKKIIVKFNMIVILLFLIIIFLIQTEFVNIRTNIIMVGCCLVTIIVGDILIYELSCIVAMEEYQQEYVNSKITSNCLTEITPVRIIERSYSSFIINLTDIAKFYAIFDEEKEYILIFVRFEQDENERLLEKLEIKDFLTYYNVVG